MVDVVDKADGRDHLYPLFVLYPAIPKTRVGWRQFFAIRTQNGSRGSDLSPGTFNKVVRLSHPARRP